MPRESMNTEAGRQAYDILMAPAEGAVDHHFVSEKFDRLMQLYRNTQDNQGKIEIVRITATMLGTVEEIPGISSSLQTWKLEITLLANELGM